MVDDATQWREKAEQILLDRLTRKRKLVICGWDSHSTPQETKEKADAGQSSTSDKST